MERKSIGLNNIEEVNLNKYTLRSKLEKLNTAERREFIKTATAFSAGLVTSKALGKNFELKMVKSYVDNFIIGSGNGGAVSALRITEAVHKVMMLEMGLDWEKENGKYKPFSNLITPKSNSTWLNKATHEPMMNISTFSKKYTGVLDRMDFDNVKVYAGRGDGGDSLVTGGMAVQPK